MNQIRVCGSSLISLAVGLLVAVVPATAPAGAELVGAGPMLERGPTPSNGFPAGDFLIVNEESGLCLTSPPGHTYYNEGNPAYNERHNQSTQTTNPTVHLLSCDGSDRQQWFFDTNGADTYSGVNHHLVNTVKEDTRGYFALAYGQETELTEGTETEEGRAGTLVRLVGNGSLHALKWETRDGFIFEQGKPGDVLIAHGEQLVMAERGYGNQHWRFEAAK